MFFSIHTESERPRFPRPHDPFLLNRGSYFIITEKHPAGKRFRKKVRGRERQLHDSDLFPRKERENLRIIPSRVEVRTFGGFDLYVNGRPVTFRKAKCKELLAFLVDKQGSGVTRAEAFAALWETARMTGRCRSSSIP